MSKIRVVVIGYGHLGKWHTEKVLASQKAELTAIVESNLETHSLIRSKYPNTVLCTDLEEIIDQVDAGIVVTPTSTHFDIVKTLLEKNKHVFCEKPLVSTFKQAKEIKKILESSKHLTLQVGHSERCHEIWDILKSKKIFDIFKENTQLKIVRGAPFKGRATDVDVVQDLMIHDLDLIYYLFGKKPLSTAANGVKNVSKNWDHVDATISYPGRLVASITSSRCLTREERYLQFVSLSGSLFIDLMNFECHFINFKNGYEVEVFKYDKKDHLLIEQSKFYDSILKKTSPFVSIDDGIEAVFNVEAVLKVLNDKNNF